jgi:hypothetical protein
LKYVPCQVLFIHRYSGNMPLATAATISSSYLLSTVNMIYALHLCRDLPDPAIGLPYPGVLVFAVGIAGNLYHHYLLSRLRSGSSGGDKGHRIPRGGLFELVTCPHYLFEIIGLFGFAMISQTTPWPLALLRTSPAGAAPPGGGISPSSRTSRPRSKPWCRSSCRVRPDLQSARRASTPCRCPDSNQLFENREYRVRT